MTARGLHLNGVNFKVVLGNKINLETEWNVLGRCAIHSPIIESDQINLPVRWKPNNNNNNNNLLSLFGWFIAAAFKILQENVDRFYISTVSVKVDVVGTYTNQMKSLS